MISFQGLSLQVPHIELFYTYHQEVIKPDLLMIHGEII